MNRSTFLQKSFSFVLSILIVFTSFTPAFALGFPKASKMVVVAPPCKIIGTIEELNANRWHDPSNKHDGALDLGFPSKCETDIAVASISGWVTIDDAFSSTKLPNSGTVLIHNQVTGIVVAIGHLWQIDVADGDYVSIGDPVGIIGECRYYKCSGRHIHFQVHNESDLRIIVENGKTKIAYDDASELQYNQWSFSYNTPYMRGKSATLEGTMVYAPSNVAVRDDHDLNLPTKIVPISSVGQVQEVWDLRTEIKDKNKKLTGWNYQVMFKVDWGDPTLKDGWVLESDIKPVPPEFPDVDQNNKFFYWIQLLKLAGIISGDNGKYNPNDAVTRGAIAKYIAMSLERAGEINIDSCTSNYNPFSDVPETHTFYPYIMCIYELRIISGYSDGTYKPDQPVRRDEMAKFVANAMKEVDLLDNYEDDVDVCAAHFGQQFPDVDSTNPFHAYIDCIAGLGIVNGYSDHKYHPELNVTRDAMAKYVANGDNSLLSRAKIYPTYHSPSTSLDAPKFADGNQVSQVVQANHASGVTPVNTSTSAIAAMAQVTGSSKWVYWLSSPQGAIYYDPALGVTTKYTVKTTNARLPSNKVNAIAHNPINGDIWACTNKGVAKFDGHSWTSNAKVKGLYNTCNDIAISPSGKIVAATNRGLSIFDGTRWTTEFVTKQDKLLSNKITAITFDATEKLWGIVGKRFSYFDGNNWQPVNDKKLSGNVDAIASIGNAIYLGNNQGLLKYENNSFDFFKPAFNIKGLTADSDGYLWIISENGKLGIYRPGKWVIPMLSSK